MSRAVEIWRLSGRPFGFTKRVLCMPSSWARNVISAVNHARFVERFNRGMPLRARPLSLGVVVSLLLALLGLALCVYLVGAR